MENPSSISESSVNKAQSLTETIVNKWLTLQKIIKEEITLEEIIAKQQENNQTNLNSSYFEYFSTKLGTRETFENVINIDDDNLENIVNFELVSNVEKCFSDAYDPVKKLLLLLRSNYDYILKIISIIDESEKALRESNTLVDLFCHQFYENILIPNPEQEELLILCYLLLEKEITGMNSASASSFIDENATFVGKFLKSFTKKQELKSYLSMTLGSLILSIENSNDQCLDLNPMRIENYLKTKAKKLEKRASRGEIEMNPNNSSNNMMNFDNNFSFENLSLLTQNIPKCSININKDLSLKDDDDNDQEAPVPEQTKETIELTMVSANNEENKVNTNINNDYKNDINQEVLNDRIQSETNANLRDFYLKQLERINKDPNIFTNKKFNQSLSEYGPNKMQILLKYKENFLFIKEKIDCIVQTLIDKITTIPYTLRCICKMIHMLIEKKFSRINTYEKNAFVGQFIFGKCILPILINSDINAIITTTILSPHTRQCLKIIAKVLDKINRGLFFEANIDTDFTIFNHYIIEVIPLINVFYAKLIDVEFPRVLNKLIQERMSNTSLFARRSRIRKNPSQRKSAPNVNQGNPHQPQNDKPTQTVVYNYFEEHKDESVNMQCICFSIEDILLLVKLVRDRLNEFNSLPQHVFFEKTIDRINNEEHKLALESKNSGKSRKFYMVSKEEQNESFVVKKDNTNYTLLSDSQDSDLILQRLKFCIKMVLKGLNLLNNKDYSYLSIADSNNNFLLALKHTLEDLDDFNDYESTSQIPLKWYSQYLTNNKKMLSEEYKANDYQKLYEELLIEETHNLEALKKTSGIVMTRNGMNIRCAEKIIEKARRDLNRIKQIERFMKMEKFINKTKIEVCVRRCENSEKEQKNKKFGFFGSGKKSEPPQDQPKSNITVVLADLCPHKRIESIGVLTDGKPKEKNENHVGYIKEFIKRIVLFPELKQEIINPSPQNQIYNCFNDYITIVRSFILKDAIFKKDPEIEIELIVERIDDHIMKKIYNEIFPKTPIDKDISFYEQCVRLSWITPAHLDIKKIYVNELKYAIDFVRKIDEGKSVYDKLIYIASAHNTINNTIKFSSGKDTDAGAEELSPIFQYIIIKAKPKRFYSNINYIKAFLHPSKLKGMHGFLLSQMEFSATFITQIDYKKLKISQEEFEKKCH